jgi:PAS domain S-box-containing protein
MDGLQTTRSVQPLVDETSALRTNAESLWRECRVGLADSANPICPPDTCQLLTELQIHQIELRMQNEQLRGAQRALEIERSRYFDLYDLAPIAYCTLNDKGLIIQANQTTAKLFDLSRQNLLLWAFFRLVFKLDKHAWHLHCQQLTDSGEPQTCELRMVKTDGTPFWGHLVSTLQPAQDGTLNQRVVISDISELKRTSLAERKAELARSLMQSQEQSRHRFSCELHDRTSANLAALRLNLELILNTAAPSRSTPAFTDCVADTWALLEDTNTGIRDVCQDLHPPAFDLGGLTAAVQSYAHSVHKRTGLAVQVACQDPEIDLPKELELALFRIVQEALTNCIKHARASTVKVNLQLDTQPMHISIADDGIGFDAQALIEADTPGAPPPTGQGLRHMRQSAEFFNALFRINSARGCGTRISLEIPYTIEAARS